MKTLKEFNDGIENLGKKLFGEDYDFSSTKVDTILFGSTNNRKTEYKASIFYAQGRKNISASSVDIEQVGEILALEHGKLVAEPSSDEINIGV